MKNSLLSGLALSLFTAAVSAQTPAPAKDAPAKVEAAPDLAPGIAPGVVPGARPGGMEDAKPAPTQEAAAELLGLPFSTYRGHLTRGLERVTDLLWERELYGRDR